MPYDEYGFMSHNSSCPHCGAGMGNNYKHDPDCLINLPAHGKGESMEALGPFWRRGKEDHARLGGKPDDSVTAGMEKHQWEAYFMGFRCADTVFRRSFAPKAA